ncbi:hypothetical protein L596_019686 [Steinernema carpocapsae]|uniref:Uncharacterized protein n=1 Tax=Steinernema carpocapsae TaxID=34508 RepID=A0A4U5MR96_STECR|nr:hypothetical protein L596_019686 [Steinernema carpocapsae]
MRNEVQVMMAAFPVAVDAGFDDYGKRRHCLNRLQLFQEGLLYTKTGWSALGWRLILAILWRAGREGFREAFELK